MAEESSDPKIVERLSKLPPFAEEDTPDAPLESQVEQEEEQPEGDVEAEGEAQTEEPEEEETEEQKETEQPVTDRTKEQFEKLKAHNAELKKKLEEVPKKNALDALYPEPPAYPEPPTTNVLPTPQQYPNLSPKEIKDVFSGLVDSNGYVDSGLLIQTLKENDQRAKEAEERAKKAEEDNKKVTRRIDDFERKQIMKEVHDLYPRLNPENANDPDPDKQFDSRVYEQFQKETMYQWSTTGTADPIKVAQKAYDTIYGNMTKANKEKAQKAELAKKNINATSAKQSSQREAYQDTDELIMATRMGKKGAIAERLARAGQ